MSLKEDFEALKAECDLDYQSYKETIGKLTKSYDDNCSQFDMLIGTINNERLSFRKEIRILYDFLQRIGGNLKEEKKISVFDFADEAPAPNRDGSEILPLNPPEYNKEGSWAEILYKGVIVKGVEYVVNSKKNKELCNKLLLDVQERKNQYAKDISDRQSQISTMNTAVELAKTYRNIVVIVKDTISEKIIPELELIQAFLYADSIREMVLDGETPTNVSPCEISEYKGTKQDMHYQFVKNTFDFYIISTSFFKRTILQDILSDRVVTETEQADFRNQIEAIETEIRHIEEKRVM